MEVVASLSQGRTAAAQCGLFTHKSIPVIFEPPCILLVPDWCMCGALFGMRLHSHSEQCTYWIRQSQHWVQLRVLVNKAINL